MDSEPVTTTAFSPVTGSYYYGGSVLSPGLGYWWSTTDDNSRGHYGLGYDGSSLDANSNYRYVGNIFAA